MLELVHSVPEDSNPGPHWRMVVDEHEVQATWSEYTLYCDGAYRMALLVHAAGCLLINMVSGKPVDGVFPTLASTARLAEALVGIEVE